MGTGGPTAMVLTELVGILVNNALAIAKIGKIEGVFKAEMTGLCGEMGGLKADIQRVESTLTSELKRVEGVLGAKIDGLTVRVKALADAHHAPLVKG